ncbi:hypothetical protein M9H77_06738 [Catharanthus roseus]|uniref:Uncharacterized protein n=1 Tax=Catharanthus roseus TaxID=4058 RepID=A0ACC0BSY0_CATRO|nr:hypothetical protein M9H77_06738 [Catharanthus roseus]
MRHRLQSMKFDPMVKRIADGIFVDKLTTDGIAVYVNARSIIFILYVLTKLFFIQGIYGENWMMMKMTILTKIMPYLENLTTTIMLMPKEEDIHTPVNPVIENTMTQWHSSQRFSSATFIKEHICLVQVHQNNHRNMFSKFISRSILHLVANDPEIPVSNVTQDVQVLFQTGCTYKRAWRKIRVVIGSRPPRYPQTQINTLIVKLGPRSGPIPSGYKISKPRPDPSGSTVGSGYTRTRMTFFYFFPC